MALITSSPANFARLLEVQKLSLEHTQAIRTLIESGPVFKREEDMFKVQKKQLDVAEDTNRIAEENKQKLDAVSKVADAVKGFKSIGDKFKDFGSNLKSKFSMDNMQKSVMQAFNFKGILDKKIAKNDFIKDKQMSGDTRSAKELGQSFNERNEAKLGLDKNEKVLEQARKANPGKTDEEIRKTVTPDSAFGKAFSNKDKLLEDFNKADAIVSPNQQEVKPLPSANEVTVSPNQQEVKPLPSATDAPSLIKPLPVEIKKDTAIPSSAKQNDEANDSESEVENARARDEQTSLLKTIAENTGGKPGNVKPAAADEGGGGGMFSGIGEGLSKLGDAAKSMLLIGAALWVVSKAFANFAELDWEGFSKGIIALGALTAAVFLLGQGGPMMIAGSAAMLIMGGALWVIGEALGKFADLEWETIGKGLVAVVGLGVVGVALGAFAPMALLGAAAMVVLGAGLWVIGEAMQSVGKGFQQMTEGLTMLSELDGNNLLLVGAGLAAIGAGMALFGAGTAAAGIGNLVGGFLNLVTPGKSPVEQILELSKSGEGIQKAGVGVEKLATGLSAFSSVNTDKIKAIAALPTEKIAAMGAAMNSNANQVYNKSGENAQASVAPSSSNTTTVVNAPVNNTTKQNQIIKSPVRNNESTINRYVTSRF
jgi:hypothetical protein